MFVSWAQLVMGMLHSELLHGRVSMPGASDGMSEVAGSLAWQQHAGVHAHCVCKQMRGESWSVGVHLRL